MEGRQADVHSSESGTSVSTSSLRLACQPLSDSAEDTTAKNTAYLQRNDQGSQVQVEGT